VVEQLYCSSLALASRPRWRCFNLQAGEENKTAAAFIALCDSMLAAGIDRKTVVIAVGGGVVGDMTGFAAATLLRGLRWVQVPTTLLAQVDSSVGGKTGLNLAGGKNLLGAFHQPELVCIAPAFLATLPEREFLSGLAEVVKYGILWDKAFFDQLVDNADNVRRLDPETLAWIIARCCEIKAAVVQADEKESGQRRLLNLGHTFGHALEALAGYDGRVTHGEAVSVGIVMAAHFACQEGLLTDTDAETIRSGLARLRLPVRLGDLGSRDTATLDWNALLQSDIAAGILAKDKKAGGGKVTLVLPQSIGSCTVRTGVDTDQVADFMRTFAKQS
ncbi:MAG: 3-dehydroquinate synthase, partial [Planctomycetes bacterium]|nr:3-dehydroquinate synthase [Planctomycetota bacterium]